MYNPKYKVTIDCQLLELTHGMAFVAIFQDEDDREEDNGEEGDIGDGFVVEDGYLSEEEGVTELMDVTSAIDIDSNEGKCPWVSGGGTVQVLFQTQGLASQCWSQLHTA